MSAINREYMWKVDEWMECAESLARECNELRAAIARYREQLVDARRERDWALRKMMLGEESALIQAPINQLQALQAQPVKTQCEIGTDVSVHHRACNIRSGGPCSC